MDNIDIQKIITRIIAGSYSEEELQDLKERFATDQKLLEDLKKELGLFLALRSLDELDLEQKLDQIFNEIKQEESQAAQNKLDTMKKQADDRLEKIKGMRELDIDETLDLDIAAYQRRGKTEEQSKAKKKNKRKKKKKNKKKRRGGLDRN